MAAGTRVERGGRKTLRFFQSAKCQRTWGQEEMECLRKSLGGKLKKTKQQDPCQVKYLILVAKKKEIKFLALMVVKLNRNTGENWLELREL